MRWTFWAVGLVVVVLLAFSYMLDLTSGRTGDYDYSGKPQVIDANTLAFEGILVRLYGIDAPDLDQICHGGAEAPYDCGKLAAGTLETLLEGAFVGCRKVKTVKGEAPVLCLFDRLDLNMQMVLSGWAVAHPEEGRSYRRAEKVARRSLAGLWRGKFDRPAAWREIRQNQSSGVANRHE